MSIVVTNTDKQIWVNVRPHRYNIRPHKTVLRTSKALCRKVASRSWRYLFSEANNIDSSKRVAYLYLSLRSLYIGQHNMKRISDSISLMQYGHARSASEVLAKRSLWDLSCETPNLIPSKQYLAFMCFKWYKSGDIFMLDVNVLYIRYLSLQLWSQTSLVCIR